MDIYVRFIGLILLYHAGTKPDFYNAIIPKYIADERVCDTNAPIVPHAAFIRVQTDRGQVKSSTNWPPFRSCPPDLGCTVYQIPDDSEISVTADDFDPQPELTPHVPCFVPNFNTENIIPNASLRLNALTMPVSTAHMRITAGTMTAYQFRNDRIFVALQIKSRSPSVKDIRVVATPRHGRGAPSVLVLAPGTVVDVLDMPPEHAIKNYEETLGDDSYQGQFSFLFKLFDGFHPCAACEPQAPAPCSPSKRNHSQPNNLSCGIGGACKP